MSRLYTRNSRGRQPMLTSGPRISKAKEYSNETYHPPNEKKNKMTRRHTVTKRQTGKRTRADSSVSEGDSSSTYGSETADDASDEEESEDEADDEDDQPAVKAPPRSRIANGAGLRFIDKVSVAGGADSMFGDYEDYYDDDDDDPNVSPEENRKRFERQVFGQSDDDNDDVYQAVDDISDSDDDLDDHRIQEHELLAMLSEEDNSDADFLLNQIDGLSAYGFGDESDASIYRLPSSQDSDSATETGTARHVHFAMETHHSMFLHMSESPTITRALLPSALPDINFHAVDRSSTRLVDDLDDSDLTDDCLPEEALQSTPNVVEVDRESSPEASSRSKKSSSKKPARRRGPPRGIFIDEGDKTSGILDPSGKIILMSNPHLLGEEFARRYGASQTSSPDVGFAELIEESDAGDRDPTDLIGVPGADIMLASLNSMVNDPLNQGQAVGPLEAFYPSNNLLFGDIAIIPDGFPGEYQPDGLGEDVISLTDVIQFDSGSDTDEPTSPIYMPPSQELAGIGNVNNQFAHLNNTNVTAFRRNADPAYAALRKLPSFSDMDMMSSPFTTPAPRRKRKAHASPYTSSHYQGVTPVQRMRDPNQHSGQATPNTTTPVTKRRKIMT